MAAIDLVVLVESPSSVASGLQRVGRAGHQVGAPSRARLFPKHRGDLLEAAVVVERMYAGAIESTAIPQNPLDVLAQHLVAMTAVEPKLDGRFVQPGATSFSLPQAHQANVRCGARHAERAVIRPMTLPSCGRG